VHIVPDDGFTHMAVETGIEDSTSFCSPLLTSSEGFRLNKPLWIWMNLGLAAEPMVAP
jgi:hypothetical protein